MRSTLLLTALLVTVVMSSTAMSEGVKDESQVAAKIEKLADRIRYHDRLYWQGKPEISDAEYDKLKQELGRLAPDHPLLQKVGALSLENGEKIKHKKAMLSLQKVYSDVDLFKWLKKISRSPEEQFLIQPKYDGIAADLSQGVLSTRGGGKSGYSISHLLPLIKMLKAPDTPNNFRGELIMENDAFSKLNKYRISKGESPYQTPRTAVVACIKNSELKDSPVKLTLVDYKYITCTCRSASLEKEWTSLCDKIRRLPYPMDGIVVKLADQEYASSLGNTAHHPRSMIARKFKAEAKQSVIKAVHWQFSEQGLIPVAEFSPVVIRSRTVTRATLHNAGYVRKNDICVGDRVTVSLTGDSIPEIIAVAAGKKRKTATPTECPECGVKLVFEKPHLRCPNMECDGVRYAKIRKQLQKNKVKGLGDKTLYKLVKACKITSVDDLGSLTEQQLVNVPGISKQRAKQLYAELQKRQ